MTMAAIVLDAGALIQIDRRDRPRFAELKAAVTAGMDVITHPLAVAQVWRDGRGRQAKLARFMKNVDVRPIDDHFGRQCGELIGKARTDDPIDAGVVLLANHGDRIMTSDPDDIQQLVDASGRSIRVIPV